MGILGEISYHCRFSDALLRPFKSTWCFRRPGRHVRTQDLKKRL